MLRRLDGIKRSATWGSLFIAILFAAIANVSALVVPKVPKGLDACKLLLDAARSSPVIDLNTKYLSPGSHWNQCEYTDAPQDLLNAKWRVSFGFAPRDSVARAEKDWQTDYDIWKRNAAETSSSTISVPTRLRGFGAEDAFVVEIVNKEPNGLREAMVSWRKGIYRGTLQLRAPLTSHMADIEDAEEIFKAIRWAAFGK